MTKKTLTRLAMGATMVAAMGLLSGCGSDKIGYVDQQTLVTKSQKGQEISQQVVDKENELRAKLAQAQQAGDQAAYQKAEADAQREYAIFKSSKAKELEKYMDDNIGEVAKSESMTVVLSKGSVMTGGEDLTDKVLDKIGRVPDNGQSDAQQSDTTQQTGDAQQSADNQGQQ